MLRLSKKTDYALVVLTHLYKIQQPASAKEIATYYSLPPQLIANILKILASSGILNSKRGVYGGYSLKKEPQTIFMNEVIELLEGPFCLLDCNSEHKTCVAFEICPSKEGLQKLHTKIYELMQTLSLEDIISPNLSS